MGAFLKFVLLSYLDTLREYLNTLSCVTKLRAYVSRLKDCDSFYSFFPWFTPDPATTRLENVMTKSVDLHKLLYHGVDLNDMGSIRQIGHQRNLHVSPGHNLTRPRSDRRA